MPGRRATGENGTQESREGRGGAGGRVKKDGRGGDGEGCSGSLVTRYPSTGHTTSLDPRPVSSSPTTLDAVDVYPLHRREGRDPTV